jgi:hypothetical protein
MFVDSITARNLELIKNIEKSRSNYSLFGKAFEQFGAPRTDNEFGANSSGILGHTSTPMGGKQINTAYLFIAETSTYNFLCIGRLLRTNILQPLTGRYVRASTIRGHWFLRRVFL